MSQRQRYFLLGIFLCLASTMLWSQTNTNIVLGADAASSNRCTQNGVEGGNAVVPKGTQVTWVGPSAATSITVVLNNCGAANCTFTSTSGNTVSTTLPTGASNPTYHSVSTNAGTLCSPMGDGLVMR